MTQDETAGEIILALTQACGPGGSICPTDAARALAGEDAGWQLRLPSVRRAAIGLAKAGRIEITRKGKPVDPETFKGVYRLRAVLQDGAPPG